MFTHPLVSGLMKETPFLVTARNPSLGFKKTSTVVKNAADKVVKWDGKSLVDAIKELF